MAGSAGSADTVGSADTAGSAGSAAALRLALARQLTESGLLTDGAWRAAIEATPRESFIGTAIFEPGGSGEVVIGADGSGEDSGAKDGTVWTPLRRRELDELDWLRLAYTDQTWVTQVDGVLATDAPGSVTGHPTSSSTSPGLVVKMLEAAGIGDGDKVLEVGTGTGYSTALLCHRLGDEAVTSVEYDPAVAMRARAAIAASGYSPTLVTGDGLEGYEKNAEYDRLIATCAVRFIQSAWIWQVRDGGTITTPLWGWMNGTALAHLTLGDDGTASGRFCPWDVAFMNARPHGRPPRSSYLFGLGDERPTTIKPGILDDWTGCFVAQLGAPSAEKLGAGDDIVLLDVATGSQASTRRAESGGWTVRQHGPLRLWDAVEDAITTWQRAGSPHQSGFGLTVTPSGQWVWLGNPGGPCWRLPV